jgi:hypothetical protein
VVSAVPLTPRLAQAIAELAARIEPGGRELVIEHRLGDHGEVCTVSERRYLAQTVVGEFERPFGESDWTLRRP